MGGDGWKGLRSMLVLGRWLWRFDEELKRFWKRKI